MTFQNQPRGDEFNELYSWKTPLKNPLDLSYTVFFFKGSNDLEEM